MSVYLDLNCCSLEKRKIVVCCLIAVLSVYISSIRYILYCISFLAFRSSWNASVRVFPI